MKQLLLIRHSKSSWEYPEVADHDRPLNRRGQRDAPLMAARLSERFAQDLNNKPQTIYTSTATRALSIAREISRSLETPLIISRKLYTFAATDLLEFIQQLPDKTHSVALVGHNPAITILCNSLTHSNIDNIPTSGIVGIVSDSANWLEFNHKNSTLDFIDTPKAKLEA